MNCQDLVFSEEKSKQRRERAGLVFGSDSILRILTFALHLMGAKRSGIADVLQIPDESVKTILRVLLRDGPPALRDRRVSIDTPPRSPTQPTRTATQRARPLCPIRRQAQCLEVDCGDPSKPLRLPVAHKIQTRTVLLSMCHAGLLSTQDAASALDISVPHCYQLSRALEASDVGEALIDKRRGQRTDYRMGAEQKAELIQEFASQAVLRLPTSSSVLTDLINQRTECDVSDRTVRWHMNKLALSSIRQTLPHVVEEKKRLHHVDS